MGQRPSRRSILPAWLVTAFSSSMNGQDWDALREQMVRLQIERRGVRNRAVLQAMRDVPRHLFVPEALRQVRLRGSPAADRPWADDLAALHRRRHDGSCSIRSRRTACSKSAPAPATRRRCWPGLCRHVYTIEIVEALGREAQARLAALGYRNVSVRIGDGYLGWPEEAPFDRIMLTAAPRTCRRSSSNSCGRAAGWWRR